MGSHFHLLVRVPQRADGFDLNKPLWQKAVAETWNKGLGRQFEIFRTNGSEAGIGERRQRILSRMFCLQRQTVQNRFASSTAAHAA